MSLNTKLRKIQAVLMRGGTSRGLIIKDVDLPKNSIKRDKIISYIYGSSKNGQVNGIGGGTSLTSKLAIVGTTDKENCDIYYTFGQVDVYSNNIDYNVTCGNMASAVGLYAVEEGFVPLNEGITTVRILNTNTNRIMEVEIPVKEGEVIYEGDFQIAGVSNSGAKIMVNFLDFGGSRTGNLLPTGNVVDNILKNDGEEIPVSIIDVGNVLVFVNAKDFSLNGIELSEKINNDKNLLNNLEEIRVKCGKKIGIFETDEVVKPETHALPKIVIVSDSQAYYDETGYFHSENKSDILGRYISMGKLHKAFAVSGAIGLGVACKISGSIPNQLIQNSEKNEILIGHPSGLLNVEVNVEKKGNNYVLIKGGTGRTARRIMEGSAIIPEKLLKEEAN